MGEAQRKEMTERTHELLTGGHYATCPWCRTIHKGRLCPLISAAVFRPDGSLKRIEFHKPESMQNPPRKVRVVPMKENVDTP